MLVDDHAAVRRALAQLLEESGLIVSLQASGPVEAMERVAVDPPDLALVDLCLDGQSSLELVRALQARGIPVVVCSSHEEPESVRQALAAGARAYLTKRDAAVALAHTVRGVLQGWVMVSPRAAQELDEGPPPEGLGNPAMAPPRRGRPG